jgi:hypothetical protein
MVDGKLKKKKKCIPSAGGGGEKVDGTTRGATVYLCWAQSSRYRCSPLPCSDGVVQRLLLLLSAVRGSVSSSSQTTFVVLKKVAPDAILLLSDFSYCAL